MTANQIINNSKTYLMSYSVINVTLFFILAPPVKISILINIILFWQEPGFGSLPKISSFVMTQLKCNCKTLKLPDSNQLLNRKGLLSEPTALQDWPRNFLCRIPLDLEITLLMTSRETSLWIFSGRQFSYSAADNGRSLNDKTSASIERYSTRHSKR